MKLVKLFLISVVVLFLLLTAISALIPSTVRISRAIDIHASEEIIHSQLDSLGKWERWNAFVMNMKTKQSFHDRILGERLQVRLVRRTNADIVTSWKEANKDKTFTGGFHLIPHGSVVTVQWYFDFTFDWYPWEKFSSIVYDAQVGPAMQESLNNLKKISEQTGQ